MLNKIHKGQKRSQIGEKCAASLTIVDAGKMTRAGRKRIAKWLKAHADLILSDGDNYSARFRGRYLYSAGSRV